MTASERAAQISPNLMTDAAAWARLGVLTADDLDCYLAYEDYMDTYKDVRGFRHAGQRWQNRTKEAWQAETRSLLLD
jgi:hypothetical protein